MAVEVLYINQYLLATATYCILGPNNNARYSIPEYYISTFRSLKILVEDELNKSAL